MGHTMQIGDDLDRLAEGELARSAANGDRSAFLTLYDGYESPVFNYCQRLLGSGEEAADATGEAFLEVLERLPKLDEGGELDFSVFLYTAARDASYETLGGKRAEPVQGFPEAPRGGADELAAGALHEDPERAALLASFQEDVRDASAGLPDRHREVLALRELDELSYDDIAGIMDMDRNAVAQLASGADLKLRDELRGSAVAATAASSPECERALPLVSMRQDGQLRDGEARAWLEGHLAACGTCRVSVEAIEEAGVSYRAWAPVPPPGWLRQATIERAGELVGRHWSEVPRTPWAAELDEATGDHRWGPEGEQLRHERALPDPAGATAPLVEAEHEEADGDGWETEEKEVDEEERRRRLAALVGAVVLLLVVIGAVAIVLGGGSEPKEGGRGAQQPAAAPARGAVAAPAKDPGSAKAVKRKRRERGRGGADASGTGSGAGGGTPINSGPALTPEPVSPPASDGKQTPTAPKEPDPVDRPPSTPVPSTPDPTPTTDTPPSVPTPEPAPSQPPGTEPPPSRTGSPPSSTASPPS